MDVTLYFQLLLKDFYYLHNASLVTNFKIIVKLPTSIRNQVKFLNKFSLAAIREAFCPTLLTFIRWFLGFHHTIDSLKKDDYANASYSTKVLRDGICPCHPSEIEHAPRTLHLFSSWSLIFHHRITLSTSRFFSLFSIGWTDIAHMTATKLRNPHCLYLFPNNSHRSHCFLLLLVCNPPSAKGVSGLTCDARHYHQ